MTVSTTTTQQPQVVGAARGAQRRRRRAQMGSKAAYLYVAPFFVIFAAMGLYPFLYTAWVSLHKVSLSKPNVMSWVGFANYSHLWSNHFFLNALKNTFTIGIISTVPQLLIALGIAHMLNYTMRWRTFFRVALILPYATSVAAATLIFSQMYSRDFGLANWLVGLFGVHKIDWLNNKWAAQIAISTIVTWRWVGYNALIYLAGMQAIPGDLYESAVIDGASRWQQFRYVTLPGLRPTILFTVVVSTIGATQLFAEPLLYGSGQPNGGGLNQFQTLGLLMYQQGWANRNLGLASTTAWTIFLLIVVLVLINVFIMRRITRESKG
ncbi:MAG TPA: sugar ABC transporter permease [Acidothermaceae bacterium]|nr:sugar ABC transporter permease [Acidothermaceae bacterium]